MRASLLAGSLGLTEEEVRELRVKAIEQMAAVNRNAPGTKSLAMKYGLSKKEVKEILEAYTKAKRSDGNDKALEPTYDHVSRRYLPFEEWMEQLLRNWEKLSV